MRSFVLIGIAILLTLLNAAKPVVVDDTAYLRFADQIIEHPLDPYGFELMWSAKPAPAFETLAPPVHLYYLALCKIVLGNTLFCFKLGLFPLILLLCMSMRSLTSSILNRDDALPWIAIVGSAAMLPMWNCMIDLPAITLGLAGLAIALRQPHQRMDPWLAGLLLGMALQTKYTALTFPAVMMLYGILNARIRAAVVTVAVSMLIFVGWEIWMFVHYGQSHFLYHAMHRPKLTGVESSIVAKLSILKPMMTYLGLFTLPSALLLLGITRRWGIVIALFSILMLIVVCLAPSVHYDLAKHYCRILGIMTLIIYIAYGLKYVRNIEHYFDRTMLFLWGWLLTEVVGCIMMSPFPAARRFLMISVIVMLLCFRAWPRPLPMWSISWTLMIGLLLHGIDSYDALAAKKMAHHTRELITAKADGMIWFQGTWGWKYYCEADGMRPIVAGETQFKLGDCLVLCIPPDANGIYRPLPIPVASIIDLARTELVAELAEDDWLRVSTIPPLYGGDVPIRSRSHPRFRVMIVRVVR